jgi:hypothetical protein
MYKELLIYITSVLLKEPLFLSFAEGPERLAHTISARLLGSSISIDRLRLYR